MRAKPPEDRKGKARTAMEPAPTVTDVAFAPPAPPEEFAEPDVVLWNALWELGGPTGTYHPVADYHLIRRYVEMQARREEMLNVLGTEGYTVEGSQGQQVQHPASRVLADVESKLVPLEDRLGLSPQARHTIQVGQVAAKTALEKWMEE